MNKTTYILIAAVINGIKIKGNRATLLVRNKTNIGSLDNRLNKETKACHTKVNNDKQVSTKVLRKSNITYFSTFLLIQEQYLM